jgi:hypothetical protein
MIGHGLATTLGAMLFDAFEHDPMLFSSNAPVLAFVAIPRVELPHGSNCKRRIELINPNLIQR